VFSTLGWVAIAGMVFTAFATAGMLAVVVERVKKCMDFTFTVYFLHVLLSWALTGAFPTSGVWWLVLVLSFIITAALGEYLCLQREMQEISVEDIMRRLVRRGAALPPALRLR
jgi:membrane-bound acyltransferase YfiQ involved in biofilm formation